MMQGTIKLLLGNSPIAQLLRRQFVFKVVPMLNPDGVYHGNTRTSLSGVDLNRSWISPSPQYYPTIWHAKQLIRQLVVSRKVALYVDYHGHSRKKNIFLYAVDSKRTSYDSHEIRGFPKMVASSDYGRDIFSFPDCSFGSQGPR